MCLANPRSQFPTLHNNKTQPTNQPTMAPKPTADADGAEGIKKKRRKNTGEKGYGSYLHKIHKQIHAEKKFTIASQAMELISALIEDLENRVANKGFELARFQKKSTFAEAHVQTATKMVFPPDMGGCAISEGTKALTKYAASM